MESVTESVQSARLECWDCSRGRRVAIVVRRVKRRREVCSARKVHEWLSVTAEVVANLSPKCHFEMMCLDYRRVLVSRACLDVGQDLAPRLVCSLGDKLCSRRIGHIRTKSEGRNIALVVLPLHGVSTITHLNTIPLEVFKRCHTRVRQRVCHNTSDPPLHADT
jgi:hypothetical protein